jgi:hypothetical protein
MEAPSYYDSETFVEKTGMASTSNSVPKKFSIPIIKPSATAPSLTPKSYPYRSLPGPTAVRLLRILPGNVKDQSFEAHLQEPIKCSMEIADLSNYPEYDALSYTWGDPMVFYRDVDDVLPLGEWSKPTFEIECDGNQVSVTANLYAALLSLRCIASLSRFQNVASDMAQLSYQKPKYIWIDALCINQSDLDERAAQVSIMHRIYSGCQSVIAWLGGEDEAAVDAWEIMNIFCSRWQASPMLFQPLGHLSLNDNRLYDILDIPPIDFRQWGNLYSFLNRSWFKRAWVVQEMGLAKNGLLLIGLKMCSIDLPLMMLEILRQTRWIDQLHRLGERSIKLDDNLFRKEEGKLLPTVLQHLCPLYRSQPTNHWDHNVFLQIANVIAGFGIEKGAVKLKEGANPLPLRDLLFLFRSTEASDPRDKIYAFLGISKEFSDFSRPPPIGKSGIVPSYQRSVEKVYVDAVKYMISSSADLKALSLVEDASFRKNRALPSWVPDFSAEGYPNPIDDNSPLPWNASEGLGPTLLPSSADGILDIRGIHVGDAEELADFDANSSTMIGDLSDFLNKLPEVSEISRPNITQKLKDYILLAEVYEDTDMEERQARAAALQHQDVAESTTFRQSRLEVFWRTLLTDRFKGHYPAPAACGRTLNFMRRKEINDLQAEVVESFSSGDSSNVRQKIGVVGSHYTTWKKLSSLDPGIVLPGLPPEFSRFLEALSTANEGRSSVDRGPIAFMAHSNAMRLSLRYMDQAMAVEMKRRMRLSSFARKLFRMNTGHLGNGVKSMRVGDQVWVFAGASMPFLLRPLNGRFYQVVGEAFVHGIMHGEAVPKANVDQAAKVISLV